MDEEFGANVTSMGLIFDAFLSYRIRSTSKGIHDMYYGNFFDSKKKKHELGKVSKEWDILFEKKPDLGYLIQAKFNEMMFIELPSNDIKQADVKLVTK